MKVQTFDDIIGKSINSISASGNGKHNIDIFHDLENNAELMIFELTPFGDKRTEIYETWGFFPIGDEDTFLTEVIGNITDIIRAPILLAESTSDAIRNTFNFTTSRGTVSLVWRRNAEFLLHKKTVNIYPRGYA